MGRNKEFNEEAVLLKAMKLFWAQGFEKTSIQDLVDVMGIHRRSIYDTFGDKHSLFLKALERYEKIISKNIHAEIQQLPTIKRRIRRLFEMAMIRDDHTPKGCFIVNTAVEFPHDSSCSDFVANSFSKTEKLLYELLEQGQQTGEIGSHHDIKHLAQFLHNAFTGFRVLVKTTDDKEKLENIIDSSLNRLD
ncbi:TetR/AcrR family transcriptional regulator [Cytobacillus horneckiae]|uniref:TetR/AcrR family transcriptional regulator n=1 Tax=Cytobacillus horneckiae TaxID=549687 RepID=UPI003D9A8AFA